MLARVSAPAPDAPPARVLDLAPPRPLDPLGGAVVDGSLVTFAWDYVPGATGYRLQASPDRQFHADVVDVPVGEATSVVLDRALPASGAPYYWRVRAETPRGVTRWSPYGRFTAATPDEADAARVRASAERAEVAREAARRRASEEDERDLLPFFERDGEVSESALSGLVVVMFGAGLLFTAGACLLGAAQALLF